MSLLPPSKTDLNYALLAKVISLPSSSRLGQLSSSLQRKTSGRRKWTNSAVAGLSVFYQLLVLHLLDLAADLSYTQTVKKFPIREFGDGVELPTVSIVSLRNSFDQPCLWPPKIFRKTEEIDKVDIKQLVQYRSGFGLERTANVSKLMSKMVEQQQTAADDRLLEVLPSIINTRNLGKAQGLFQVLIEEISDIYQIFPSPLLLYENEELLGITKEEPGRKGKQGKSKEKEKDKDVKEVSIAEKIKLRKDILFGFEKRKKTWVDSQFEYAACRWFEKCATDKTLGADLKSPSVHQCVVSLMGLLTTITGSVPWFIQSPAEIMRLPGMKQLYEGKRTQLLPEMLATRVRKYIDLQKEEDETQTAVVIDNLYIMIRSLQILYGTLFVLEKDLAGILQPSGITAIQQRVKAG